MIIDTSTKEHLLISENLNRDGYAHLKSCVDLELIHNLKSNFVKILSQFSNRKIADSYSIEDIDSVMDNLFNEITGKSTSLRENIFKVFSKNMMILNIPTQEKISQALIDIGVSIPTLSGFGVLAMEPDRHRFLFHPHQDLHNHYSYRTVNLWVPLTSGHDNIGGMGIAKGQHTKGPMPHSIADDGQLELTENQYDSNNTVMLENVPVGDAILFDTHAVHWSILNKSSKIRWTVYLSISNGSETPHLADRLFSFDPAKYIDIRKNEERIKEAQSLKDQGEQGLT